MYSEDINRLATYLFKKMKNGINENAGSKCGLYYKKKVVEYGCARNKLNSETTILTSLIKFQHKM